ncbi:MAG TPA: RNA-binding protein [Methylomirabilota bacterium]|nr:RNA-binding protein [Methylomirabilota bacterium]
MSAKLYVGGLSFSTNSESLREYFSQCGTVESATVITDKFSGQSRGFGFVEMSSSEEAQKAISQLNGKEFEGRTLTVNVANPQGARSGGGRPGGGGGGGRRGGGGGGFGGGKPRSQQRPARW